jgi:signal transduction histidine kinase
MASRWATESRQALEQLADEQAALRRVATLVAQGAAPADVFAAVSVEVDRVFHLDPSTSDVSGVIRFEPGPELAVVGVSKRVEAVPLGSRFPPDELFAPTHVLRTARSARIRGDDVEAAGTEVAAFLRHHGYRSQVASPIVVDGHLWGAVSVNSRYELPSDTEERLERFTGLIATAIANAQSREALELLVDEQAALRRVATLVARDAPSTEVFEAVATEVGKLLDTDITVVGRYDGDGAATAIGSWTASGDGVPVGTRSAIGGRNVLTIVAETGKPARMDGYDDASGDAAEIARRFGWRSSIAAPIVVEDRVWGVMLVATQRPEPFAIGAEDRLAAFTEMIATAVANAEAHDEVRRFGDEQSALRRVATLVARGVPAQDVFDAVAEEVGRLLLAANVSMGRYEPDDSVTSMASWSSAGPVFTPGVRWPIKGTNVAWMVLQTGRPARIDDFSAATDPIGIAVREAGYTSAVGSPIVVEGHLWGAISAASTEGPMPPDSEARLASFTELVATAIANAASSAELAASRRRIVAASDDARRRIERDLHDGVQQQLVSLGLELGAIEADPPTGDTLQVELARVKDDVSSVLDALVEIARGIHPAILSQGGLAAALKAVARRSAVPVKLHAQIQDQLPDEVEVAAYYIAAEALTNAAKHAHASVVNMEVATDDRNLSLVVRDDGVGGADPGGGSGLVGLQDRVEALGGTIKIDSASGSGTCVVVTLPSVIEPDRVIEDFPPQSQDRRSLTDPA